MKLKENYTTQRYEDELSGFRIDALTDGTTFKTITLTRNDQFAKGIPYIFCVSDRVVLKWIYDNIGELLDKTAL